MAKLSAADRQKMPKSKFAVPEAKDFPLNDAKHQRAAISGASRSYNAGNIGKAKEDMIKAKARKKLGISKGKKK